MCLSLITPDNEVVDVARETGGRFGPRTQDSCERWEKLLQAASSLTGLKGRPLAQVAPHEFGRGGRNIPAERAWSHVAGVSVGQDLSERTLQAAGPAPQYSLAKSFPGFGPIGPLLVSPDEFEDPDVIFTGTPPGVGVGRMPQRFLAPGDELATYVRGVGDMRHRMQSMEHQ